jgi:fatty acid desaturase
MLTLLILETLIVLLKSNDHDTLHTHFTLANILNDFLFSFSFSF